MVLRKSWNAFGDFHESTELLGGFGNSGRVIITNLHLEKHALYSNNANGNHIYVGRSGNWETTLLLTSSLLGFRI